MKSLTRIYVLISIALLGGIMIASGQLAWAAPANPDTPGDLNPFFGGFGDDGNVIVNNFAIADFALQADGSLILAGYDPDTGNGVLSRRLPNGDLDMDFGDAVEVRISNVAGRQKVAIQEDGKLVFGSATDVNGQDDFLLARFLPDGSPDTGFGVNGTVTTDFAGGDDGPNALAFQADGKILLAGSARSEGEFRYALARYHTNGTLDTSFGGDGTVVTDFETGVLAGEGSIIFDIFVQPDGKIVAGGSYTHLNIPSIESEDNFAVARYNPDGSLDDTFHGNGKLGTDFGDDSIDSIIAIRYLPGGNILAVGRSNEFPGPNSIAMALYHSTGGLNSALDGDGKLLFNVGVDDIARDVWVQPDGKYLLLVALGSTGGISLPTLVRLLPDGSLDTGFGNGGSLPLAAEGGAGKLVVQPDGKILVSDRNSSMYRLLPNFGFDTAGQTVTNFAAAGYDVASRILLQPDGKLLVAGSGAAVGGAHDIVLARYLPDGAPDESFGIFGMTYFATNQDEYAQALALQPDGKILVAGTMDLVDEDFVVYRLTADGMQDKPPFDPVGFNFVGYRIIDFGIGNDRAMAVAVLPDGKILLGGHAWNGTSPGTYDFALARLDPDGTTDFSFGTNGKVRTTIGSGSVQVRDMVVMPDGRILLGGGHNPSGVESSQFTLAMYLSDGSPDTDFGPDNTGIVELGFEDESGTDLFDIAEDLLVLPTGEVLVTGFSAGDWVMVVIDSDGNLADYGIEWPIRTAWPVFSNPTGVELQVDGKVIAVGGGVNLLEEATQFYVARYNLTLNEAGLDETFGSNGQVMTTIQERARAYDVAISEEDIYVAGFSDNGENLDFTVANYITNQLPPIPAGGHQVFLPVFRK